MWQSRGCHNICGGEPCQHTRAYRSSLARTNSEGCKPPQPKLLLSFNHFCKPCNHSNWLILPFCFELRGTAASEWLEPSAIGATLPPNAFERTNSLSLCIKIGQIYRILLAYL